MLDRPAIPSPPYLTANTPDSVPASGLFTLSERFLKDFPRFAGKKGVVAIKTGPKGRMFDALDLNDRFQRLAFLLTSFAVLMILRAVVISMRDISLARLQIGFVKSRGMLEDGGFRPVAAMDGAGL
jgi:hypothetical protein